MEVYLVWHVRHAGFLDGTPTEHFDEDGDIIFDEHNGDSFNILGIFSSEERAQARIDLAKTEPGFEDEPDCFSVAPFTLDEDRLRGGIYIYDAE